MPEVDDGSLNPAVFALTKSARLACVGGVTVLTVAPVVIFTGVATVPTFDSSHSLSCAKLVFTSVAIAGESAVKQKGSPLGHAPVAAEAAVPTSAASTVAPPSQRTRRREVMRSASRAARRDRTSASSSERRSMPGTVTDFRTSSALQTTMPSQRETHLVGVNAGMLLGERSGEPSFQNVLKPGFWPVL